MAGWFKSLLHAQDGYFQTLPRLGAALALLVPFRFAPLLENILAIILQVLPVNLLISERCGNWGPLGMRAGLAFVYIALPNSYELNASMEEAQWHLALLACMVILSSLSNNLGWRLFDLGVIVICGLSGPFCLMLLPVALGFWWFRRESWRLVLSAGLLICAAVQLTALLHIASSTRRKVVLGASPKLFIQILAGHVYVGALLGQNSFRHAGFIILLLVAVFGTAFLGYCCWKASLEGKFFLAFSFLVFALSLKFPMVSTTEPQWNVLEASAGVRYWFFPTLAFAWAVVWQAARTNPRSVSVAARIGLLVMCLGILGDWKYPPFTDFHFPEFAGKFAAAAPQTRIVIPIYPPGWTMQITKKAP